MAWLSSVGPAGEDGRQRWSWEVGRPVEAPDAQCVSQDWSQPNDSAPHIQVWYLSSLHLYSHQNPHTRARSWLSKGLSAAKIWGPRQAAGQMWTHGGSSEKPGPLLWGQGPLSGQCPCDMWPLYGLKGIFRFSLFLLIKSNFCLLLTTKSML